MAEPERRRRRPAVSCQRCRKNKIRCNRESPCNNCGRSKTPTTCVYESQLTSWDQLRSKPLNHGRAASDGESERAQVLTPVSISSNASTEFISTHDPLKAINASTIPHQQSFTSDLESMKGKIRQLEEQLSQVNASSAPAPASASNLETLASRLGGTIYVHHGNPSLGQSPAISRSVTHKSRHFGTSHWINTFTLFQDIPAMIEKHRDEASNLLHGIEKCKSLGKIIKSQRAPPWPCLPVADLPQKNTADKLVDCYLRTTETIYRVLHIPTFRRGYEDLWITENAQITPFLVQVKLVLAIGALTLDDQFSMRSFAIQWIYEAQTWLAGPKFKSRLDVLSLQTEILFLLAQESAGNGGEPMWISAGSLVRKAFIMGLHRDPKNLPFTSAFTAEIHRRLWNTILELNLQSGLTSGGLPFISLCDFDTEPPGNFDDDQLTAEAPVQKQEGIFTKTSIAIALRKTFPIRLEVINFLNNLKSQGTYEGTLSLDVELKEAFKILTRTLQICNSRTGLTPSRFEISTIEFIMHRYLSALHVPFFGPSLRETTYAYSRKVVIETSLRTWYAAHQPSSLMASQTRNDTSLHEDNDLARLVTCSSGFFRTVPWQAALLIAVELHTQVRENDTLGPALLRPDLLSALGDAKSWCLQCIRAGDISVKGYLLMCVLAAQIDGVRQGVEEDGIPRLVIQAGEDAVKICLPILEEMASKGGDGSCEMTSNTPFEAMEDLDFMMSDAFFNTSSFDPMSWLFNDEAMHGASLL